MFDGKVDKMGKTGRLFQSLRVLWATRPVTDRAAARRIRHARPEDIAAIFARLDLPRAALGGRPSDPDFCASYRSTTGRPKCTAPQCERCWR